MNIRGKAIFTWAHPHRVKALAAKHGAIGIVSAYMHNPEDLPDAVAWVNSWSDDPGGWPMIAGDTPLWGFNLSPNQGRRLAHLLSQGEIHVHAEVNSRLYEGSLPIITGRIQGDARPGEELLVLGHLFEQGAIDNASGGATMLEIARLIQTLIKRGKLRTPRRSIRFLFTSECYGTYAYMHELMGVSSPDNYRPLPILGGLCLDSTGGSAYAGEDAPGIHLHFNPHALASYADAFVLELAQRHWSPRTWTRRRFSMTDNLIADPAIGVPCPWIAPVNRYWHTSADTMDKVVPEQHTQIAVLGATYLYLLADAQQKEGAWLAKLVTRHAGESLEQAQKDHLAEASLSYLSERMHTALDSVGRFIPGEDRNLSAYHEQIRSIYKGPQRPRHTEGIVPSRLCKSTITFDRLTSEEREGRSSPRWSGHWRDMMFWCDGVRTIDQIAECMRQSQRPYPYETEQRPLHHPSEQVEALHEMFEFLARRGYVECSIQKSS